MKYKIRFKALDAIKNKVRVAIQLRLLHGKDDLLEDIDRYDVYENALEQLFPYEDAKLIVQLHIKWIHWEFITEDEESVVEHKINDWLDKNKDKLINTDNLRINDVRYTVNSITRPAYVETAIDFQRPITKSDVNFTFVEDNFIYRNVRVKLVSSKRLRIISETDDAPRVAKKKINDWVLKVQHNIVNPNVSPVNRIHSSVEDASQPRRSAVSDDSYLYYYNKDVWEDRYDKLKQTVTEFVKKHYKFVESEYSNHISNDQGSPTFMITYIHKGETQHIWVSWSLKNPKELEAYKTYRVNDYRPFYDEELRLLDRLDIPLSESFIKETGQSLRDWF